jgi:hypothetical protein
MINWLGYLLGGKVLIFLWQLFPLPNKLEENKTIHKLHTCDLCSGVYLFTLLAFVFKVDLLSLFGVSYIILVNEFVTGAIISFIVHIFSMGWIAKFSVVEI